MNMRKFFLGVLVFCLGSLVFFISRCNMINKSSYYVLECRTGNTGNDNEKKIYAASIILVANAPCLKSSLKRNLETFFWENITLDTINRYNSMYGYRFYRETKYLTKDFKEGGQYNPEFSSWDNTMDWRNHLEDRLGEVCFFCREDKTGFYVCRIAKQAVVFHWFEPSYEDFEYREDFNNINDFWKKKRKELGIDNTRPLQSLI